MGAGCAVGESKGLYAVASDSGAKVIGGSSKEMVPRRKVIVQRMKSKSKKSI